MAKCFSGVVNEMQGGGWEAGGVLKNHMEWRKGIWDRRADCDNERTAREKKVVSGRSRSPRLGIKEGHFNHLVQKGEK